MNSGVKFLLIHIVAVSLVYWD